MPSWTMPPPLGGLRNNSSASGNNDGFNLLAPASAFDTGTPAVPFVSSGDANYSGGLLGMFAAPDGSDPNQPAPADDEQEQANLQALEDRLSSSGSINDAWALYKARMASGR
jgi:hypothetical protein